MSSVGSSKKEGTGKTVLVVGASGYIAGHCIRECLERGYSVRGTVRKIRPLYDYLKEMDADNRLSFVEVDLTKDEGWDAAAQGVDYVIHTANPMPGTLMKDPETGEMRKPDSDSDYCRPALDGMKRLLDACRKAATVKRVVVTSSIGSINWEKWDEPQSATRPIWSTAEEWTPVDNGDKFFVSPYAKSKTLAEKMALDYCAGDEAPFECIAVLPAFVLGPWYGPRVPDSVSLALLEFMDGTQPPIVLPVQNSVVDVRDVAIGHVNALTKGKPGARYLLAGECLWFDDIWRYIRSKFGDTLMTPTFTAPLALIDFMSMFDPMVRNFVQSMAASRRFVDNTPSQRDLDVCYRPSQETLSDTVQLLFEDDSRKPGTNWLPPVIATVKMAAFSGAGFFLYRGGVLAAIADSLTSLW